MRFIIYGAGGIGGTIGARLYLNHEQVVLIARGAHYEAIKSHGLSFHSPTIHRRLPIQVVDRPQSIDFQADDVVILCMKTQHVEGALRDLQASAPATIPVVCCQNGVASERMALRRFQNVYGMVVWLPAEHLEPGVVVNFAENQAGNLDAGRYPNGTDAAIERVTNSIQAAGFACQTDPTIMRQKYAKLLVNLTNVLDAAAQERPRDVIQAMQAEALACWDAAGIDYASAEDSRQRRSDIRGGEVKGFERHGSSTLQSLLRSTGDLEVDYMNGEIAQLGRLHGLPTPVNNAMQRIGVQLIRGAIKPRSLTHKEISKLIADESG